MGYSFTHFNFNVLDLARSVKFYEEAFNLFEAHRLETPDFTLIYLNDGKTEFELELTHLHDRKEPYNLGEKEYHLALYADNFDEAYQKHKDMGIICYENKGMGIYFVEDPDGYWIEVLPSKKKGDA